MLDDGTGNDDHPHADIRNGDAFLSAIFQAVTSGPAWQKTVLVINFDEWGGFFEHVAPPRVVAPNAVDPDIVNGQVLLGFRTPAIVISPFTRNTQATPLVNHSLFDHTSVLKLIEWRWNLPPLTLRDGSSQIGNLASAMDFANPNASVPPVPLPSPVLAAPCFANLLSPPPTGAPLAVPRSSNLRSQTPWTALAVSPAVQQWGREGNLPSR